MSQKRQWTNIPGCWNHKLLLTASQKFNCIFPFKPFWQLIYWNVLLYNWNSYSNDLILSLLMTVQVGKKRAGLYCYAQFLHCIYFRVVVPSLSNKDNSMFYKQGYAFEPPRYNVTWHCQGSSHLTFMSAWCSRRKSALLLSCRCMAMCSSVCPSDMVSLMPAPEPSNWAAIVCMPGK